MDSATRQTSADVKTSADVSCGRYHLIECFYINLFLNIKRPYALSSAKSDSEGLLLECSISVKETWSEDDPS